MKTRIFNLLIIDESGSMQSIAQQAISGLNETIQTIRKAQEDHPDQEHFVSLVSFNSEKVKTIHDCIPASELKEVDADKYWPSYGTPLFDAMGNAINHLRRHVAEVDNVLVTIITDGYENASREYSGSAIKALVEEMKAKGWIFTYIGANQDAKNFAKKMSINNALNFEATKEGTTSMWEKESRSRSRLFDFISWKTGAYKSKEFEDTEYNADSDFFTK